MEGFIVFIVVVGVAILFLRGFDKIAGRGSKQVKDGIAQTRESGRIPCPHCAELILPAAKKCPFCRSDLAK
jgi:hypothetical protein